PVAAAGGGPGGGRGHGLVRPAAGRLPPAPRLRPRRRARRRVPGGGQAGPADPALRPMHAHDVVPAAPVPRMRLRGGGTFPGRRRCCGAPGAAAHGGAMRAAAPASKAERVTTVFFRNRAGALVPDGVVPCPAATSDLRREVELAGALGRDAPPGVLPVGDAAA